MNNGKTLVLVVIALLLAGILGVSIYEAQKPDTVGEQVGQAIEDVGDSIQDATN